MWKGAITFGLVTIPVRLYAATEQRDVSFRQVHREDGGRIRFQRVCSIDGAEVPYSDVAKGYELPDGELVVITDDDLAELPLPTSRSIDVLHFAPAEELDPILHARAYFTEPEPAGVRAYALMREALEQSGKVAIAKVALRQRESLAALRVRDEVIVLETLLWPDEIRVPDFDFLDDDVSVRPQELKMAASLINSMTVDFDPSQYTDGYREALEEVVAAKVQGRELKVVPEPAGDTGARSLLDALKASLAEQSGDEGEAEADEGSGGGGKRRASGSSGASGSGGSRGRGRTTESGKGKSRAAGGSGKGRKRAG
jgi:DNA end-binding protein Ku